MKLPFDILSQNYVKPKLYLCETDKQRICQLETINLSGSFKFNAYSELNFSVGRTYMNMVTGETLINPFYHKIEALRLVYLEGFGYFEIQDPEIVSDGIKEIKNVTAYSLEYRLSQKYLENFKINTGEADSLEVIAAGNSKVTPIVLLNNVRKDLSLLDLTLEKIYDWTIGYIDPSLKTMSRQFEISRASVYDFIVQDICEKFNCYAIFDTINNKINLYAESLITKHIGDGKSNTFIVQSAYEEVDTVTIDSYKTTKYSYSIVTDDATGKKTGYVVFDAPPGNGARIEITDGSQKKWQTDVYVTFDNLAQEVNISYSAEDIKTVLTVKGQDDLDIREVNMGLPYIVDLSYYYTVDWMGQDLYDAYTKYLQNNNKAQTEYAENSEKMFEIADRIAYETNRMSLEYSEANYVTSTTVGTYYVKCGTKETGFYYKEVQLPDEYNANTKYWMLDGTDLDVDKFSKLYSALQTYFSSKENRDVSEFGKIKENFMFVEKYTIETLINTLSNATTLKQKDEAILKFFDEMWDQLGQSPLNSLYLVPYKSEEATNAEAGWNDPSNENYWKYYPVTLVIKSIEKDIEDRRQAIKGHQTQYSKLEKRNNEIAKSSSIYNNFTHEQLIRLSPFLREDEYTDDNFVETDSDTIEILMKTKQELLECGKIELAKLCEPKLAFSMDMANIYALKEFEPIIHQFQLGKLINVAIRDDYVKRARLLAVDINFDDFSDFSCEFGELTSLRTPSSIHADLLANALSAGSSVASNASYWEKGADLATSTDLKIQNGLLAAVDGLYNGDKSVLIDNHGILLRQVLDNGEYSPYQIWLTNNTILVSTDSFQTAQTGIGVFEVDGRELYGVLAKAILSGYIESSTIVGGRINIGNGAFIVDEFGNVTMTASNSISGYTTTEEHNQLEDDLSSKIELNKESITAEVTRATSEEEVLNSRIKINSDSITAETSRATSAEDVLGSRINMNADSIVAETSRATNAEEELSSKIKINADAITAEVNRATGVESELSSKIEMNADSISAEVSRATNAENGLNSKITINANAITAEVNRATSAEGTLDSKIKINADSITAEVTRAKNAENNLSSKITVNANAISAEVTRAQNAESSLSSKIQVNANSITAETSRATNAENALSSKITINANSITTEVTRAKNAESSLSAKIDVNAKAITSKVSSGDFGTLIEQNYDHVKIAWNKNSKYIKFEDATLKVYNSSNTLLMKLDYLGSNYYRNGTKVGRIGTTHWHEQESYRGLTFDLEHDAGFMCWSAIESSTSNSYSVKLIYHHNNTIREKGLHLACNTYANGYLYLNDNYRIIQYTSGGIGYSGEVNFVNNSHTVYVAIDGSAQRFTINNNVAVDIYSSINMHNYYINNVQITQASDARLKTNIQDTNVDALNVLSQIDMKEFDWIETGEHEDIGMIAQQLQMIEPSLVHEDEKTGSLSIKTSKLIPYLIKAIQELHGTIKGDDIATYRSTKSSQWVDEYNIDDKESFIASLKSDYETSSNIKKEEVIQEPIIIPIDD